MVDEKESTPLKPEAAPEAASDASSETGDAAGIGLALETEPEEPKVEPTGRKVEPGPKLFHWGTGRRKTSVARVRLRPGTGEIFVNGKPMREFFPRRTDQETVLGPLQTLDVEQKVDIFVNVRGGGNTGQAGAVRMGLGRCLVAFYPDAHDVLRDAGHLTRDPRMVERKKYGLAGARRAFQWVKR